MTTRIPLKAKERGKTPPEVALPNNLQMEKELIAALFCGDQYSTLAFECLNEKDFSDELCKLFFMELRAAWQEKFPYTAPGALVEWFTTRGGAEKIKAIYGQRWEGLVIETARNIGLSVHMAYYVNTLRQLRKQRGAVVASLDLFEKSQDRSVDPSEWIKAAREWCDKIEKLPDHPRNPA